MSPVAEKWLVQYSNTVTIKVSCWCMNRPSARIILKVTELYCIVDEYVLIASFKIYQYVTVSICIGTRFTIIAKCAGRC